MANTVTSILVVACPSFSQGGGKIFVGLSFGGDLTREESSHFRFQVSFQTNDSAKCLLHYVPADLESRAIPEVWRYFLRENIGDLSDYIAAQVLISEEEDMVLVCPDHLGKVWFFNLVKIQTNRWEGELVHDYRPARIDMSYALRGIESEEWTLIIAEILRALRIYIPQISFPNNFVSPNRRLIVKVSLTELWFLRFPLDLLARRKDEGFRAYSDVEWIVTQRKFIENCLIRERVRRELADVAFFLQHSVIILNTYLEHADNPRYCEGTALVLEVLGHLTNIAVRDEVLSLRYVVNPSEAEIRRILSDPGINYFFADFESRSGEWQLGQDIDRTLFSAKPLARFFSLHDKHFDLSHITLMRVFHCNSVFDPAREIVDGREPADHHSIVRRLLDAGALRVEGGLTEENYFDYLSWLLRFFCALDHLGFILKLKCVESGIDFEELMRRVDSFLTQHGWPTIGNSLTEKDNSYENEDNSLGAVDCDIRS